MFGLLTCNWDVQSRVADRLPANAASDCLNIASTNGGLPWPDNSAHNQTQTVLAVHVWWRVADRLPANAASDCIA